LLALDRTGPDIAISRQLSQVQLAQCADLTRHGAAQKVKVKKQVLEVGQQPQFSRDVAFKIVVEKVDCPKIRQGSQKRRDCSVDLVGLEGDSLQRRYVCVFIGDGTQKIVRGQR